MKLLKYKTVSNDIDQSLLEAFLLAAWDFTISVLRQKSLPGLVLTPPNTSYVTWSKGLTFSILQCLPL